MFKKVFDYIELFYETIREFILLRNKNLTADERDIIIFGDLKTADEKLGRVRLPDGTVRYKQANDY